MIWNLKQYRDKVAIIEDDNRITYEELNELSEEIAERIGRRSLVFILCSNTAAALAGYVGFVNRGIVPLLLDSRINRELLDELITNYHPSYIWMPSEKEKEFPAYVKLYEMNGYILFKTGEMEPFEMHRNLAVLIPTSGSTGSPKLVRQTYRNIEANTRSIIEYLKIDENERAITTLPMNYVYGLSVLHTHLYAGATIIMTEMAVYSKPFWELFDKKKATSIAGVPFIYEMLKKLDFPKFAPKSLKTMTQAGGKLSAELQQFFSEFAISSGRRFIVMYGASEATARMGYLPFEKALEKKGSIGVAIPGGKFGLVNEKNETITESGQTGELVYYGDNVTMGYSLTGKDLIKEDENEGRLLTGDMAYRDDDGFYYIVGRKKRFLKVLGKRINLDELETILKKEYDTTNIACAGKDDNLRIFIVDEALKQPVSLTASDILGISPKLCKTVVIDEVPKNSSGKTLYGQLNDGVQ